MQVGKADETKVASLLAVAGASSWDAPDPALTEFLETLRDGVIVVGADRRVKYMNASYLRQFGLQPGDISIGDDISTAYLALANAGRLGTPDGSTPEELADERVASWGAERLRSERRYIPNGAVLDIYRSETTTGDTVSICVDATEAELTSRELERQRGYMESVLEHTSEAITLLDRNGNFVMYNTRLLELYDIDPDKVFWGMPYDDFTEQFGDLANLPTRARRAEIAKRREFAFDPTTTNVRRPLANGRTLNINKTNLPDGGCVMTMRDITEDLAREEALVAARREAEESSRHKSEFVARMSHEMRTPLNGILGVAALMERGELAARERKLVDVITSSGRVLLRLIDDILDLSRMDADTFELVEDRLVVGEVLKESLEVIRPSAEEAGLELRLRGELDKIPPLRGDNIRIKQILLNLLTNAVKFTERGSVDLRVDSDEGPEGVTLTCAVVDTGVGISEEKLGQIFQRFYQIDGTVTRRHGGAGLGLSITRKLVDLMGGTIQVESELGKGTVFTVRLTFERCNGGAD
ncbi:MAG: ATP-binding protein [Pseudomonadota bacterium]